jgi:uncharacterized protein (DUF302 family)
LKDKHMPAPTLPDGLTVSASSYGPAATADRLAAAIVKRGMMVLARIDHASAATKVGLALRPTELLIFGNARAGTPLMQSAPTIGIDLPLKALVFQDDEGKTWVASNKPEWLAARHHLTGAEPTLENMSEALAAIVQEAI